ncbi:MAG TPA: ABC transporter ATP-binding protein [Candidatus Fimiplasma intestinipullorum]|uniref:ABC transporter ATP-binding protein n=1 Tax=Candidatus Fimiplasma intestinipullorum TaxID=2840825 RepID=A0A9D1HPR4_9FIRM|nr:ABC transporter ATP-binding protein [Candidatus Fimiplasma intestinipullorum]
MITLEKLSINFGKKVILKDARMSLVAGKLTGLVGKSGSGKTSLLNLLQERFKDKRVLHIYQQDNFFEKMSCQDNLMMLGRLYGLSFDEKKIQNAMAFVGLKVSLKAYPSQLSGGEKQRLLLVMALLIQADVILLDEITASMDQEGREQLIKLLRSFAQKTHCIMVLATHDPILVAACDMVYAIDHHQLICQKEAQEERSYPLEKRGKALPVGWLYLKGCFRKQAVLHLITIWVEGLIVACLVVGMLFFIQIDWETQKVLANTPSNQLLIHHDNNASAKYNPYHLFFSDEDIERIRRLEGTTVYPFFNWQTAQYPSSSQQRGDWYYEMTLTMNGNNVTRRHVESKEDPSYAPPVFFPYYDEQQFDDKAIINWSSSQDTQAVPCYLLEDYLPYLGIDWAKVTSLQIELEVNIPVEAGTTTGYQIMDGQEVEMESTQYTYVTVPLTLDVLGVVPHKSGNYQEYAEIYLPYETMATMMASYGDSNLLKDGQVYYASSYMAFSEDVEKTTSEVHASLPNAGISHSQITEASWFQKVQERYVATVRNLLIGVSIGALLAFVLFSVLNERSFRKDRLLFSRRLLSSGKLCLLVIKQGMVESVGIFLIGLIGFFVAYNIMYRAGYMVQLDTMYAWMSVGLVLLVSLAFGLVSHLYSILRR